ncbi:hypothetical protein CU098_001960, partial [Rhizopus stolonifer]
YLRRPPEENPDFRLDRLLKRKAVEGVKIYIVVYKEMSLALTIDSVHTKQWLQNLHPNIIVQRHPDHSLSNDTVLFWSHHEKIVVVDNRLAFVGGLDLCFGKEAMQKLTKFMLDSGPNATSTLVNGVSIIIDIIRHNNADLETDPAVTGLYGYSSTMRPTPVSLADMLTVMSEHVPDFTQLLLKPRSTNGPMRTPLGEIEPLGFERLKICELFAELLHCSNMSNLNEFNEESSDQLSVGDYLKSQFVKHNAMPICI